MSIIGLQQDANVEDARSAKGRRVTLFMVNSSRLAKERRTPPLLQTRSQSDAAFVIPQATEWQRIGNQINAAMIFARTDFVGVL